MSTQPNSANDTPRLRILMFYHSVLSDWNHGNAHFLRGVATELANRGHQVTVYEPRDSWSMENLLGQHGIDPVREFFETYPTTTVRRYRRNALDLGRVLEGADIVIVHERNDVMLVKQIGLHRRDHRFHRLYFHDTHHRMVTHPESIGAYDLTHYDGVLAYGRVLRELYKISGRVRRAWTWHEAADTTIFHPPASETEQERPGDVVWIGNWGDDERTSELKEFLISPVKALKLKATAYGVRYPDKALAALAKAGISYGGWISNFKAPRAYDAHKFTVHVPGRQYTEALPGIPSIRSFEALACGIPLISAPWEDCEGLFAPGEDFLVARNGSEMKHHMQDLLADADLRRALSTHGLATIRARHTCKHRVDELLAIDAEVCGKEVPRADEDLNVEQSARVGAAVLH